MSQAMNDFSSRNFHSSRKLLTIHNTPSEGGRKRRIPFRDVCFGHGDRMCGIDAG